MLSSIFYLYFVLKLLLCYSTISNDDFLLVATKIVTLFPTECIVSMHHLRMWIRIFHINQPYMKQCFPFFQDTYYIAPKSEGVDQLISKGKLPIRYRNQADKSKKILNPVQPGGQPQGKSKRGTTPKATESLSNPFLRILRLGKFPSYCNYYGAVNYLGWAFLVSF